MSNWDKFSRGDSVRLKGTTTLLEVVDYIPSSAHGYIVCEAEGYAFPVEESDLEYA